MLVLIVISNKCIDHKWYSHSLISPGTYVGKIAPVDILWLFFLMSVFLTKILRGIQKKTCHRPENASFNLKIAFFAGFFQILGANKKNQNIKFMYAEARIKSLAEVMILKIVRK